MDTRLLLQKSINNAAKVNEIYAKRHDLSLLLGYSSYSEMVLKDRMADSPAKVQKFEEDLIELIKPFGQKEL